MTTVKDIIVNYLRANGFDALCGEECGCGIDDIAPCVNWNEGMPLDCHPAHKTKCTGDKCPHQCDSYDGTDGGDCYTTRELEPRSEGKEGR